MRIDEIAAEKYSQYDRLKSQIQTIRSDSYEQYYYKEADRAFYETKKNIIFA